MSQEDREYFRRRADEERRFASMAAEQSIANIHLALAAKYDELAKHAQATNRQGPGDFSGGLTA